MNKHILGFLLPVAGIFAIISPASALTESFTQSYSGLNPSASSSGPATGTVSISQFNSALGTLTSINVVFIGTTTFTVDGTNLGGGGSEIAGVTSASQQTVLTTPDLSLNLSGTSIATGFTDTTVPANADSNLSNTVTVTGSPATGSSFDTNGNVSSTSFAQFIGSSQISLDLTGNASLVLDGNNTADFVSLDSATSTSGNVTVTYNYTPLYPLIFLLTNWYFP